MGRPTPRFHDFVGHKKLINPIRRELEGARARGEPMSHMLFTGPSGVGKSRLAEALAKEYGTRLLRVLGGASREKLVKNLLALQKGDFLFIDEGQALKQAEQEMLFEAIDRSTVEEPRPAGRGGAATNPPAEPVSHGLPGFTLILATDRPGDLLNAMKRRLPVRLHLPPYGLKEMREIVAVIAADLKVLLSSQATGLLARVSHGIPGVAWNLLERLRNAGPTEGRKISSARVKRFLRERGIDKHGLGPTERRYLYCLARSGGASLETLALFLGTDRDEVMRQVEPILVRKGLIAISPSGRRLTARGEKWVAPRRRRAEEKRRRRAEPRGAQP